jgi:ParB-like chromosome segregation protein Spo0J
MSAAAPLQVRVTDETRKTAEIKIDPRNARKHPEKQIAKIANSIAQFGYVDKLAVRPNSQLIAGEGRFLALQRLPEFQDTIDVRVVHGLTDRQYRLLGLALNKLPEGSSWDDGVLAEIISEAREAGDDVSVTGFEDAELSRILGAQDPLEVSEIKTTDVDDEFWISVRGPLRHQAKALQELERMMKKLDGVTVELGTIAMEA